ncbi:unnamed protein product [Rhizophagus irregularis]|nr:unnamed protein product [Rhizophagus irregularis]
MRQPRYNNCLGLSYRMVLRRFRTGPPDATLLAASKRWNRVTSSQITSTTPKDISISHNATKIPANRKKTVMKHVQHLLVKFGFRHHHSLSEHNKRLIKKHRSYQKNKKKRLKKRPPAAWSEETDAFLDQPDVFLRRHDHRTTRIWPEDIQGTASPPTPSSL